MAHLFPVQEVLAAGQVATSTSHNLTVAWPYVLFSICLAISLISIAMRILRNQTD